jgi:hypothetical protein
MTSLNIVEVAPGRVFPVKWLRKTLKKPVHAVKFAKVFDLTPVELSSLLRLLFPGVDLVQALTQSAQYHSNELQTYIVALGYEHLITDGEPVSDPDLPDDDTLAELFEQARVVVASSMDEVAEQIDLVMGAMPGKQGRMAVKSVLKANRRALKKLGVDEVQIVHGHHPNNLAVLDCSGSMTEYWVRILAEPVVRMAMEANAHLAIVSSTARVWRPGEYSVESVLDEAEYGGTHYETLAGLFEGKHWGTVVTVADYDSAWGAKEVLAATGGTIDLLLDISLVQRPTFLAECLEPLAKETRPLLVGNYALTHDFGG